MLCHTPHDAPTGTADRAKVLSGEYRYTVRVELACVYEGMAKDHAEQSARRSAARALGPCQPYTLDHIEGETYDGFPELQVNYWRWSWSP